MNVLLTTPAWPPETNANGIVTYVAVLKQNLERLGVDVRVLTGRIDVEMEDPTIIKLARSKSIPPLSRKATRRIAARALGDRFTAIDGSRRIVRSLERMASSFRPDVVEMEESFGTAALVARGADAPVVVRLHGPWFLNGDALGVPKDKAYLRRVELEGECIANARAITSPSVSLLERVRRKYQLELPHAEVIPNPAPQIANDDFWSFSECDPNLIAYVGRFDRHKGGDLMIDAFATLARERPDLKLAFVGPDRGLARDLGDRQSLRDYVDSEIPEPGIRERIDHRGQLDPSEILAIRKRARAVVVASRFEVFGMVVVEALAQGCPLVAADVGGISEIVDHETTGLLFQSSNASDLAVQLARLLDDRSLSERLGQRGQLSVRHKFDPQAIAEKTKRFYERLVTSGT
jgi:glycosyltransferase involved in cell wall biosynthesis